MISRKLLLCAGAMVAFASSPASAALTLFDSYTGNYGLSTDGGGGDGPYTVSAEIPADAVITAAYLYQATWGVTGSQPMTFNGNAVTFDTFTPNDTACCSLGSSRADVTGIVASAYDSTSGGIFTFDISEGNSGNTDGVALVVVFQSASLPNQTVAILDGFASVTGDTTTINFANPLDPNAAGFTADIRLGIGFSCCGQRSTVDVNGERLTSNAGNRDDGGADQNGRLITVGGYDDPFAPVDPSYATDTERYDLTPFISAGDTSIVLNTANSSQDDNIFLLAGVFTGIAGVNEPPPPNGAVPEPSTWAMMLLGFFGVGGMMRRRGQLRSTKVTFA